MFNLNNNKNHSEEIVNVSSKFGELFEYYFIKGIVKYILDNNFKYTLEEVKKYLEYYSKLEESNKLKHIKMVLKENNLYEDYIGDYIILEGYSFFNKNKILYSTIELILFNDLEEENLLDNNKNKLINKYFNYLNKDRKDINYVEKNGKNKGHFINCDLLIISSSRSGKNYSTFDLKHSFMNVKADVYIKTLCKKYNQIKNNEIIVSKINFQEEFDNKILSSINKEDFKEYFNIISNKDPLLAKHVQAGSYLYTFLMELRKYIEKIILFNNKNKIIYGGICYSEKYNKVILNEEQISFLEQFHDIYKNASKDHRYDSNKDVLSVDFFNRKEFKNLDFNIGLQQTFKQNEDFLNLNNEVRDIHTDIIFKELKSGNKNKILFLLGNPGVGKTSSIIKYLIKEKNKNDKTNLFFYSSPRTLINDSIKESFEKDSNEPYILLNSNDNKNKSSSISLITNIENIKDLLNNDENYSFMKDGKLIFNINDQDKQEFLNKAFEKNINQKNDQEILPEINLSKIEHEGVFINLIRSAKNLINYLNKKDIKIKNFIITVSLQAMNGISKKREFLEFFKSFENNYIMLDEILGSENGIQNCKSFLDFYIENNLIYDNKNNNFIFCDASISSEKVLKNIFNCKSSSNDNKYFESKINIEYLNDLNDINYNNLTFFPNKELFGKSMLLNSNILDLKIKKENENLFKQSIINVNSFPAKELTITYKNLEKNIEEFSLLNEDEKNILLNLKNLNINNSNQLIIYKQNKEMANIFKNFLIKNNVFQENEVKILNSFEKTMENMDSYKIFIITSTSSRGISYPKCKHIIVFLNQMDLANELMEINQLIYRMRGGFKENGISKSYDQENKKIDFYIETQKLDSHINKKKYDTYILQKILEYSILSRMSMNGVKINNRKLNIIPIGRINSQKKQRNNKSLYEYDIKKFNEILKLLSNNNAHELLEDLEDLEDYIKNSDIDFKITEENNIINDIAYIFEEDKFKYDKIINLLKNKKYIIENGFLIIPNAKLEKVTIKKIKVEGFKNKIKNFERKFNNIKNSIENKILINNIESYLQQKHQIINLLDKEKSDFFVSTSEYNDEIDIAIYLNDFDSLKIYDSKGKLDKDFKSISSYFKNKYNSDILSIMNNIEIKDGKKIKCHIFLFKNNINYDSEIKIGFSLFPLIIKS